MTWLGKSSIFSLWNLQYIVDTNKQVFSLRTLGRYREMVRATLAKGLVIEEPRLMYVVFLFGKATAGDFTRVDDMYSTCTPTVWSLLRRTDQEVEHPSLDATRHWMYKLAILNSNYLRYLYCHNYVVA
jgi:hypothetical protein